MATAVAQGAAGPVIPWLVESLSGSHSRSSSVIPTQPFPTTTGATGGGGVAVHNGGHVQGFSQPQVQVQMQHTVSPPPIPAFSPPPAFPQAQAQAGHFSPPHSFSPQGMQQLVQGHSHSLSPPPAASRSHSRNSSSSAMRFSSPMPMPSFTTSVSGQPFSHPNHSTPAFSNPNTSSFTSPPFNTAGSPPFSNPNHSTSSFSPPYNPTSPPYQQQPQPPAPFHSIPPHLPLPEKSTRELTRPDLLLILTHFASLLPTYFPPPFLPLRLVAHGGACMLLHSGLFSLSQSLPSNLKRRTTTRDVDIIERGFKKEMEGRGMGDAVGRLRRCRDECARYFGLGRDWMNADADVALPFAVDAQGHQSDSIYTAALSPDNITLHTIFTSPDHNLSIVSVTPFWAVALKLVRYTKWDPGDVCLLLRNGTILSNVQWTREMLETWLFEHCWEMGYHHYPPERKRELQLRIENALELMKSVWPDPNDKKEYPKFYEDKTYSPEGAMGGGKTRNTTERDGWKWSLAGVQGDATGAGALVSTMSSQPQSSFVNFGHVTEWAKDSGEEGKKRRSVSRGRDSKGRSKSRSRGASLRASPNPPTFGNPNRDREREEERERDREMGREREKQGIFIPPLLPPEDFTPQQHQQWHAMNPNHAPVTARPRAGSGTPPEDVADLHSHMGSLNLGSIYAPQERKSRNANPWQQQSQKDVDAFNMQVEGLYRASYVHTVDDPDDYVSGDPDAAMRAYAKSQARRMKERKEKEKRKDRRIAQDRDEKWTLTRLPRDSSVTVYTDSSFDSSSEEEVSTESESESEEEGDVVGRGRSASGAGLGLGAGSQWQVERMQTPQFLSAPPAGGSREQSRGRKSKSPSPQPKRRPPPLNLPPMPMPQPPQQQQQQQQRPVSRSHTMPQLQPQPQSQVLHQRSVSRSHTVPVIAPQPQAHWSQSQSQSHMQFAPPPQQIQQQQQFAMTSSQQQQQMQQYAMYQHQQQMQQQQLQQQHQHQQHQQQLQHQHQQQLQQQPQAHGMGSIYATPHVSQPNGIYQQTQPPLPNNTLGLH